MEDTKQELQQVQALVDEGLTSREIAQRLARTEAAIRNLRHREAIAGKPKMKARLYLGDILARIQEKLQDQDVKAKEKERY